MKIVINTGSGLLWGARVWAETIAVLSYHVIGLNRAPSITGRRSYRVFVILPVKLCRAPQRILYRKMILLIADFIILTTYNTSLTTSKS